MMSVTSTLDLFFPLKILTLPEASVSLRPSPNQNYSAPAQGQKTVPHNNLIV